MSTTEVTEREMLIDRALPRFDFTRVEHEVVEADQEATYAAVRRLDFLKVHSPLMDAAMWVRGVPDKVARATGRRTEPPKELPSLTFDGMVDGERGLPGWLKLGEDPPREIAFGAIGKFWQMDITWLDPVPETLEAFTAFDDAGLGQDRRELLGATVRRRTVAAELRGSHRHDRRGIADEVRPVLDRREPVRRRHHAGDAAHREG